MLENLTKKIAEKMGRSVKETIQPIVKETSKKVDTKIDLYSRVLRLFVLIFLFVEGTKKVANDSDSNPGPSQIVINNYLYDRKDGDKNGS